MAKFELRKINQDGNFAFSCGDKNLDSFFLNDRQRLESSLYIVSYQLVEKKRNGKTIALFSLSNATIKSKQVEDIDKEDLFLTVTPAVRIVSLGVDLNYQSKGIGRFIIIFLTLFFVLLNKTGCRYLLVDAYNNARCLQFYERQGFKRFKFIPNKSTVPMYKNLEVTHKMLIKNDDLRKNIKYRLNKFIRTGKLQVQVVL